ncbi:hypothetical protein ACROYT_G037058 [Oculina patagonica]
MMNTAVGILLLYQLSVWNGNATKGCETPLGMENKGIPDSAIKATTVISNSATGASNARLHYIAHSGERGAWSPSSWEQGQWIQVDLGNITMVTKIATQGRKGAREWVTEYKVSYSFDGGYYKFYQQASNNSSDKQVFQGNRDDNSVVINTFNPPIVARLIRFHPVKFYRWPSLRMELYGCHSAFPSQTPPSQCEKDLGMESYAITDSSVTASSIRWAPANAGKGRLHFFPKDGENGGWVAKANDRYGSWFQVDFGHLTKVTTISTQGRQDASEWVTKYNVSYGYDGILFRYYQENGEDAKIFDGNKNRHTVVSHKLKNPFITRYIRINPVSFHGWISLRAEFYGCRSGFPAPKISGCRKPLGMESGQISKESITASSSLTSGSLGGPDNARLHFKGARGRIGAWMPRTHDHNPWLQVDFGAKTRVTGISTQGSYDAKFWIESYSLRYSNNGSNFTQYQQRLRTKTFLGNTNQNGLVGHELVPPIQARCIRVIPESWHWHIALRLELYGCPAILAENGGYSQWSAWTQCSVTCGFGRRSRSRSCTNPPPGPYGNDCSDLGSENQTAECNSGVECPQLENNSKTIYCNGGEDCPHLGNNNQTAKCRDTSCKDTFVLTESNSSSNQTIAYASISAGILVALILFIGLMKHFLTWKKRFSPPPEFKYHAFIIYSQEDSHWVNGKLLPFLEERHYLKCCIHYRDFTPGKPFTESMAESVYNSYKIIAVLSSNFLKSNYCCYELNIAKYRLLKKRDDSLIIVRIDIESECRKLPRELRKRNFIDYSNCFERPLWESKLLRFLNVQDDSNNQHATEKQTDYNSTKQVIMCVL